MERNLRRASGMQAHIRWSFLTLVGILLGGCTLQTEDVASRTESVVYGADDRLDYYDAPPRLQEIARRSVAALMPADVLDESDARNVRILAGRFEDEYYACRDQRFLDQPVAAFCSSTLIDDDLVLTAGHCVDSLACEDMRVVFDYYYERTDQLAEITANDVYRCAGIVWFQYEPESRLNDYAIIRLNRHVDSERSPARLSGTTSPVPVGSRVTIIGFGAGLPAKIDEGGRVIWSGSHFFEATLDAFGGNSGSGVFDEHGGLVGVLSSGRTDFVIGDACYEVNVLDDPPADGYAEVSFAAQRTIDQFCAEVGASAHLCGTRGVCGDGLCDPGETCIPDCVDVPRPDSLRASGSTTQTQPAVPDAVGWGKADEAASDLSRMSGAMRRGGCSVASAAADSGVTGWALGVSCLTLVMRLNRRRRT